jgi:hypothetical protein
MLLGAFFVVLIAKVLLLESAPADTYELLRKAQLDINLNVSNFCYGTKNSRTKQEYLSGTWSKYIMGDLNILVYPFCLTTNELGNRLGNYFTEIACAEASGLHFVAVHKAWDLLGSFTGNYSTERVDRQKLAFLNALPDIIVHPNPLEKNQAHSKIKAECKCTRYCWGEVSAPWVNRTQSIRKYLRVALKAYNDSIPPNEQTHVAPDVDVTNAKPGTFLPIIPDVSLQYRCGDNIAFSYHYGILPFTAFLTRIPPDSKYIYVLSDHPSRAIHSPYSGRCQTILLSLFEYLQKHFPKAIIVVKRGGDLFLDQVRLAFSNTTICSASSYCFWPGLANQGVTYFPVSSLIAGADTIELAPDFGPNFKWIDKPGIISNMKHFRPWTAVLDVLTGKTPPP